MENIFDRLQFVKHEEVFATREDAYDYVINHQSRGDYPTISDPNRNMPALFGEPMVLLYESNDLVKGPNVILAIGSVGDGRTASNANKTFFIDTQKTEEEIEELWGEIEELYKLIGIIPLDSDTIDLSVGKTSEGTVISGDVKLADYRIVGSKVEENIIETEGNKGIYAFVDMDYDPNTFAIKFKTTKVSKEFQLPKDQHVERGWYSISDEAIYLKLADGTKVKIDVVNLIDEWTVLGNASSTPITLYKEHVSSFTESHDGIYDWQDLLTADVRVADHINDNILHKDRTGRYLYVKGTADNIKYKEGVTVKEALDNVDCKVSTSLGNLVYKRPDGIYATAMVGYNAAENKLTYTYSDGNAGEIKTIDFQLNSVKLLEDITYDPINEMIVIRYIDAQGEYQRVEIPVHDIIEEWDVNNEGHDIKLKKFRSQGQGKDILSADAKIHEGDNNILDDLNHELYVNGISDNIKYDVTGDTTVKDVLDSLSGATDSLQDDIDRIDATIGSGFTSDTHENITAKFEQISEKLESEIERSTEKDNELEEKINNEITRSTEKDAEHDEKIETTENTIGSGFSTDAHETVTYKFEQLKNRVNEEADKLQQEIERSTAKDDEHDGKIQAIEDEIGDGFGPRNTVRDEIDSLKGEIDELSGQTANKLSDIDSDNSINIDKANPTIPFISVNLSEESEQGRPNIIKLNNDGLYAGVDLAYEESANKLIFTTTNGSKEIQLDSMSSIISIEYNPTKEAIVITYMTNGHEIKTVEIPVGDLINEWRVEDGHPHAVQLEKVRIASGTSEQDVLKASVIITDDHDDNILVMDDGALYVPGAQISANTAAIEALAGRMDAAEDNIDALEDGLAREIERSTQKDAEHDSLISELRSDLNDEIDRSTTKDQELTDAINNEVIRATSAETALNTALNNEIARSTQKDAEHDELISGLRSDLTDEITRATTAEGELRDSINNEITRATSAETALNTALNNEIARSTQKDAEHDSLISGLRSDLTNEIGRATAAEGELRDAISAETNARIAEDTRLNTKIDNEISRATTAEENLYHLIEDEAERRESGDTRLSEKIDTETARARETEQRLETAINNEVSRAQTKENELNMAITQETLRAQAADNELYQKIADETAERASKDAELESLINQEKSRAQVSENTISERLISEIERSTSEDEALNNALTAETAAREAGDAELAEAIRKAKITFSPSLEGLESDGTIMFNEYSTSDNIVKAKVMLQDGDNIIKIGNGLYATATLEYEPTGNKLRLVTSNGAQEYIQLVGATLLDSIEYNPINKMLIIKYTDGTGSQRETSVGVTDLWNEWIVQNPSEKSAIELTKTIGDPGNPDTISGRVLITDDRDGDGKPDEGSPNIIEIRNNGLFVDGTPMEDAKEIAECVQNELKVFEKAVIGHIIGEECGSGYTYEPWNTAYYINSATSYNNVDYILDLNLKRVENYVDIVSAKTDCVDEKTDKVYEMLYGEDAVLQNCGEDASYKPYISSCVISGATSFMEADKLLSDQICELLTMWVSGKTCTSESECVEEGENKKMLVHVRLSRGNSAEMSDDDIVIENVDGDYIDPTRTEFTDTNALRIVCLTEGPSGTIPSIDSMQNGVYLSNVWDCGLYYDEATEADAIAAAQAAGYKTDNYRTDTASTASNYNYMNNVRQHDI